MKSIYALPAPLRGLALAALLALFAFHAHGAVFKCTLDGRTSYQASPCADGASERKVLSDDQPRDSMTSGGNAPDARAPTPDREAIGDARRSSPPGGAGPIEATDLTYSSRYAAMLKGAEIHVVSGYEPVNAPQRRTSLGPGHEKVLAGRSRVVVDRPNKTVLLVLSSYKPIEWTLQVSPRTRLEVVLLGDPKSTVAEVNAQPKIVRGELGYASNTDDGKFEAMLDRLHTWLAIDRVQAAYTTYQIAPVVSLGKPTETGSDLSVRGAPAVASELEYPFDLHTRLVSSRGLFISPSSWTNNGPRSDLGAPHNQTYHEGYGAFVEHDPSRTFYILGGHNLYKREAPPDSQSEMLLPEGFPRLSWPSGLAYDVQRELLLMCSFGGEGYLYRYDLKTQAWKDFASLNNLDLQGIAYVAEHDRLLGWSETGNLFWFSPEGKLLDRRALGKELVGFKRLFDRPEPNRDSGPMIRSGPSAVMAPQGPRLNVIPVGKAVVIVAFLGGYVERIWLLESPKAAPILTYRRDQQPKVKASRGF